MINKHKYINRYRGGPEGVGRRGRPLPLFFDKQQKRVLPLKVSKQIRKLCPTDAWKSHLSSSRIQNFLGDPPPRISRLRRNQLWPATECYSLAPSLKSKSAPEKNMFSFKQRFVTPVYLTKWHIRVELSGVEWSGVEWSGVEWSWVELSWVELSWVELSYGHGLQRAKSGNFSQWRVILGIALSQV